MDRDIAESLEATIIDASRRISGMRRPTWPCYDWMNGTPDRRRRRLYDLYHALNHLNLFGTGYASMVRRCLEEAM